MPSSDAHSSSLLVTFGLGLCLLVQISGCAMAPEQLALRRRLEAGVQTPEDMVRFRTPDAENKQLVASGQDWPPASTVSANGVLMKAASNGDLAATKAALNAGAHVNAVTEWGSTPVQLAAQQGQGDVVRHLLRAGAVADGRGGAMSPLAAAALGGHAEVVKLLISKGAQVDGNTDTGESPLMQAVRLNRVDAAAALLEAGARLQARSRQGDSLCMVAINENYPAMLALLLRHGASPSTSDRDGLTPLYWAEFYKRDDMVQLLLAAGAKPDVKKLALPASSSYTLGEF
ncbi:ankyrin repeat domain-containing protein [Rhodoferax sp. GW822-FHT02A01]|uniref:ankyrin repeat domain-containing protein n=1 Tax=Rhodoferax sp. GW822-FHT02A01 TaxID=3141537 RepID=UPI00315C9240